MVILATFTTVIASQAVITGAFSLTKQAIQLGYLPRFAIEHTSAQSVGQIFVPRVNFMMMLVTIFLVITFKNSSNLAAAYGLAVSATMIITSTLMFFVTRYVWGWGLIASLPITLFFLFFDIPFFIANLFKLFHGGWIPLVMGLFTFTIMTTWRRGRQLLSKRMREATMSMDELQDIIVRRPPEYVAGTAFYMTSDYRGVPMPFVHNLKHNKVMHETVYFVTVVVESVPVVESEDRISVTEVCSGIKRVLAHYGFMEDPSVANVLSAMRGAGEEIESSQITYFLGKETVLAGGRHLEGMSYWRDRLFVIMSRNAQNAALFYKIPSRQAFEIGMQLEI
jgi:KUP system potassium uptake protein